MAGLRTPLSTLHVRPHDRTRMTRGRCGSLLLHRNGLAPSALCRSPGAPDAGHSWSREGSTPLTVIRPNAQLLAAIRRAGPRNATPYALRTRARLTPSHSTRRALHGDAAGSGNDQMRLLSASPGRGAELSGPHLFEVWQIVEQCLCR